MNDNGNGKDERTISPCPICGRPCDEAGTGVVLCRNKTCVHRALTVTAHNALYDKIRWADEHAGMVVADQKRIEDLTDRCKAGDEAVRLLKAVIDLWVYPKRTTIYEAKTFLDRDDIKKIGGGK